MPASPGRSIWFFFRHGVIGALVAILLSWIYKSLSFPPAGLFAGLQWWALIGFVGLAVMALIFESLHDSPSTDRPFPGVPAGWGPEQIVSIWKQVVNVQMHFNEMLMRVRRSAITVALGALAAAGVVLERGWYVHSPFEGGNYLPLATVLVGLGLFGWALFYLMDRHYYHWLLVGSVTKASEMEKKYAVLDLGCRITEFSRIRMRGIEVIKARDKLDFFYGSVSFFLALFMYLLTAEYGSATLPP